MVDAGSSAQCGQACASMVDLFQTTITDLRSAVLLRPHGSLRCDGMENLLLAGSEGAMWLTQTRQRIEELERELNGAEAEIALRRSAISDANALHTRLVQQGEHLAACNATAASFRPTHTQALAERRMNTASSSISALTSSASALQLPSSHSHISSSASTALRTPPRMATVKASELTAVPKYMAGRLTVEKLNAAIEELQSIVDDKYRLLHSANGKLSEKLLKKQRAWKEQESKETKGSYFFTEYDVREGPQLHVRLDGTSGKGTLATLVHVQRLKCLVPTAPGGVRRYVIVCLDIANSPM